MGEVEAGGDAGLWGDNDVFRSNGGLGVVGGGGELWGVVESRDAAGFVYSEVGGEVVDNLIIFIFIAG